MSRSITFSGGDLSTYGLTVLRMPEMPFFSPRESASTKATRADGAVAPPSTWGPKTIKLPCIIRGTSYADLTTKLDAIASIAGQREDAALSLGYYPDRYWMARMDSGKATRQGVFTALMDLDFVCNDPFAYAATASTFPVSPATGAITTPGGQSFTLACGGSVDSFPDIQITLNAASSKVALEILPFDTRLEYTGALAAGDILRIQSDPRILLVSIQRSGGDEFWPSMVGVSGRLPALLPGSNTLDIYGCTGTVAVTWRSRYL